LLLMATVWMARAAPARSIGVSTAEAHVIESRATLSEYPEKSHSLRIVRLDIPPADARHWQADHDSRDDHHGEVRANAPMSIVLDWHSAALGQTVRVGAYRLYPRALINAGFCRESGGMMRLRFVRDADGVVSIQTNDSSPALPVGLAEFA
jgi:hypothetical protein